MYRSGRVSILRGDEACRRHKQQKPQPHNDDRKRCKRCEVLPMTIRQQYSVKLLVEVGNSKCVLVKREEQ